MPYSVKARDRFSRELFSKQNSAKANYTGYYLKGAAGYLTRHSYVAIASRGD